VLLLAAAFLFSLAGVTVLMLRRRWPAVGAGVWWFLLALGPVSNVIVPINILVAERFLYLPAGGWLLALGGVAAAVSSRRPDWRPGVAGLALAWFAFLAVTAGTYARYWAREETLWNGVVAHSPDHFRGYQGLAKARLAAGDYPGARQALRTAVAKGFGQYAEVYFDLGRTYLLEDRRPEAVSYLRRAVDIWRREGKTARSLAYVRTLELLLDHYEKTGQAEEARRLKVWLDESRRLP